MKFHHRAVPIVLVALLIAAIGFGIVLPVLPGLIVHLGGVGLPDATRIAGFMLVAYAAAQFFAGPVVGILGDRFGRRPVLLASMTAFAIDYGFMAAAPSAGPRMKPPPKAAPISPNTAPRRSPGVTSARTALAGT